MNQPEPVEPSADGQFSFADLPRAIWFFLGKDRYKYLLFTLLLTAVFFYNMVPPYLIGMLANFLIKYVNTVGAKPDTTKLFMLIALLGLVHALVALVRLSSKRVISHLSLNARYNAKVRGFERLLDFSLAWHQQESTGNKAQRILTGSEAIRQWTGELANNTISALTAFFGSLLACLFLSPYFFFFFAYYLGVMIFVERYFDTRISRLSNRINLSMENASGTFVEGASNILAVKAMGAADDMVHTVEVREGRARKLSYDRVRMTNTKWMCFQVHNAICWAAYLAIVGWMVMKGDLAAGFFLTYSVYFERLRDSSTDFTDRIQTMIELHSNLGRMMPIFWGGQTLRKGTAPFPEKWDGITIKDAVFRYGNKPAIGPMSVDIRRGEIIGIAGHSGSGKSTLIKLLLGLYHLESGELKVGNTPISDIRHEALTNHIAVVLQETEMFNLTLRENITMLREVDEAELEHAIEVACLGDVIKRLPLGLDTPVGERGTALSGGERQRVGIARAVCRKAPILLLDEATSALDSGTEQKVMQGLLAQQGEAQTMVIVAHRISTLKEADKILVFERGNLVEQGTFAALSKDPETRFGKMYAIQS